MGAFGEPRPRTDGWVPLHFRFGRRRWAGRLLLTLLGLRGALLPPPQIFPLFSLMAHPACMAWHEGGFPQRAEYNTSQIFVSIFIRNIFMTRFFHFPLSPNVMEQCHAIPAFFRSEELLFFSHGKGVSFPVLLYGR